VCKELDDLMPINVTVTNSGKVALPEIVKNVTIYIGGVTSVMQMVMS